MVTELMPETSNGTVDAALVRIELDRLLADVNGQQILSQSRCVNELLDLRALAVDPELTTLIDAGLADMAKNSAVTGPKMTALLEAVGELLS